MKPESSGIDSIQRYPMAWDCSPAALADAYFRWLDHAWGRLVRVDISSTEVTIKLFALAAIRLVPDEPTASHASFRVLGGALARPGGVFVFRAPPGQVVFELLGFRPVLPLWLYRCTHGPVHVWTMIRFARSLTTTADADHPHRRSEL